MIHLLIVHPSRAECKRIAAGLKNQSDIAIAGYATGLRDAVVQLEMCNLVLVSATLSAAEIIDLIKTAAERQPSVAVIIMAVSGSKESFLQYVEAGASGYIADPLSTDKVLRNIRATHNDKAHLPPRLAAALMSRLTELSRIPPGSMSERWPVDGLTPRETDVFELLQIGLTNEEIAKRLNIKTGTVKNHVHRILGKLEVSSRREFVNKEAY